MEQSFTRLSPRFNFSTALYHNGEYLLIIDRAFNMESYRRIYFRDIQSLQIQKTATWLFNSAVMGIGAGVFAVFGLALWFSAEAGDDGLRVLAAIMFALMIVFGALMARYLILGATCKVYACTAVQRIYLPNICTMRKLGAFTDLISPLISTAQGTLAENELRENLAELWKCMRNERRRQGTPRRKAPKAAGTVNSPTHPETEDAEPAGQQAYDSNTSSVPITDATAEIEPDVLYDTAEAAEGGSDLALEPLTEDSREGETDVVSS